MSSDQIRPEQSLTLKHERRRYITLILQSQLGTPASAVWAADQWTDGQKIS